MVDWTRRGGTDAVASPPFDPGRRVRAGLQILAVVVAVAALVAACSGAATIISTVGTSVGGTAAGTTGPAAPGEGDFSRNPAQAAASPAPGGEPSLIIKTGSLSLQVADLDAALSRADAAVSGVGGYVSASQRSGGDKPSATVTYRIPAARWDEALTALHALAGKVLQEQTQAVEVTGQVLDLGARIDNLQVTEKALQAIMAKATKIADVLAVQQQLTDVRGQIEQLQTEKKHLEEQAGYGTLAVSFQLPVVAVTAAAKGWDPGTQFDEAVAQLVEIGQGVATAALWAVVVGVPVLVLLTLLVLALLVVRRWALAARRRFTDPGRPVGASPEA